MESFTPVNYSVYSTSMVNVVPLSSLLRHNFSIRADKAATVNDVLNTILASSPERPEKYVFLDAQAYINDPQTIRCIKDIISRYALDKEFMVNLIFITQSVCVPMALERLAEIVFFDLPGEEQLKKLSDRIYTSLELNKKSKEAVEVVNNLKGLTLFEVEQAYLQSYSIYQDIKLDFIRNFKKSSIAKTDLLSLMESNIPFEDIGGMENLKKWIKKSGGGWTMKGRNFGLPFLKGLLLVGLSGCGKSLIMKSIGNEWGLPVVSFNPAKVFSSRVGDSEANISRVLQIVENLSPCILCIDEIEKGFSGMESSNFSDSGVTSRVIGTFLIWMQECTKPVFTIATANNIEHMPPEMISRFDETFFVNLPQEFEREEIFKIHITKLGRDPGKFDLKLLAKNSKDLSGREIEQVLKESMYDAFYVNKDLDTETILQVLTKKTTLLLTMSEQLKYLMDWVGFDAAKNDGIRARYASPVNQIDISRVNDEIEKLLKDVEKKDPFKE